MSRRRDEPAEQLHGKKPFKRRRRGYGLRISILVMTLALLFAPARVAAAFIDFENCLDSSITRSRDPPRLQWVPLHFDAVFDEDDPNHNLRVTVYGNVTGQTYNTPLPPPDDPYWSNANETNGKIANISEATNKLAVFDANYKLLTYTPWTAPPTIFCDSLAEGTSCPIGPVFNTSSVNATDLPAFTQNHNFNSTYSFSTLSVTLHVNTGDDDPQGQPITVACVSAPITPALGSTVANVISYLPVVILFFVALGVICASIFTPWGSSDPFKWTSNYGRDQDLIRLVTPGFGDCLQYIQFVVLAGSLSLNYPGFFQPVVSQASWAALMFNESFVSHGNGFINPQDGVYVTRGRYGLTRMSQLVGMSSMNDLWAGTIVWVLVIIGAVIVVCEAGFLLSWVLRKLASRPPEDLRNKNWPMIGGNLVRIVCNYFLLPIVSVSFFQLVTAEHSPAYVVALAAVIIVAIMVFAGWILRVIFKAKPRSNLFDDLPTVLLYGPLYNTYSDDAAPFALIPALLTFVRGIAIGAVQPSGIAQIVILAICEVILILTLNAFRPFHSPTSMNAYHTFFAAARFTSILLSIAFIPNLGVTEAPRGWIGYIILGLHAVVLTFGFFVNAVQTLIEVVARTMGAGGDRRTGAATRGGLTKVFGSRQLSRRARRPEFSRSLRSDAAILTENDHDAKSQYGGRSRSMSASSAILLNQRSSRDRLSGYLDQANSNVPSGEMDTPTAQSTYDFPDAAGSYSAGRPSIGIQSTDTSDPYYRAPRQRRATGDLTAPGARSRGSWVDGKWVQTSADNSPPGEAGAFDLQNRPTSFSPDRLAISPGYLRERDGSDPNVGRRRDVDYAVREVDFYYGVRGPALNAQPTRKLKTGPADPVGPVSSATGWFKSIFGGKSKDSGKGFEVVRSARAPPQGFTEDGEAAGTFNEPYSDHPQQKVQAEPGEVLPGQRTRRRGSESDDSDNDIGTARRTDHLEAPSPYNSDDEAQDTAYHGARSRHDRIVSAEAPSLGPIDAGGDINLPSRVGSRATTVRTQPSGRRARTSPRSSHDSNDSRPPVPVRARPPPSSYVDPTVGSRRSTRSQRNGSSSQPRIPFTSTGPSEPRNSIGTMLTDFSADDPYAAAGEQEPSGEIARDALGLPMMGPQRPDSIGRVQQHRASDGLREGSESQAARIAETEYADDGPSPNRSPRRSG